MSDESLNTIRAAIYGLMLGLVVQSLRGNLTWDFESNLGFGAIKSLMAGALVGALIFASASLILRLTRRDET